MKVLCFESIAGSTGPSPLRACVLVLAMLASTATSAASLIYQPEFRDAQVGYLPPSVLVGFNPQPEPPAPMMISGDISSADPRIVFSGIESGEIDILIGIGGGLPRLASLSLVGRSCGIGVDFKLYPAFRNNPIPAQCRGNFSIQARFTDRSFVTLNVNIRASVGDSLIPPGSMVSFNPQPEPPAVPSMGLRINMLETGADTLIIDLSLSDQQGNAIALR